MSEENETNKDGDTPTKERAKKPNPFLSSLRNNQVAQAKEALMKTVCDNTDNTMGSILEALENDPDGEYIMLEIFKSLTVEELVQAAAPRVLPGWGTLEVGVRSIPIPRDDTDDDLDDDDEFEDDGSLDDDDDDAPAPPKATAKRKSNKKKGPPKKKVKAAAGKKAPPKATTKKSSGDEVALQKAILKCLSENKAKNADSAMSGKDIRDIVECNDVEFRAAMSVLREKERAGSTGQARGTKYFRIPKKRV